VDRILEVVAGPVAADVGRAWAQLLELRRDEFHRPLGRMPSDALAALYRDLLDRYPPFEEDPTTTWGDAPMALYFGDRLAAIPITASRVEDAVSFVIGAATRRGLTVFDVAGERIHRPDAEQVLPASLTADAPWRDRLDHHEDRFRPAAPPATAPIIDSPAQRSSGLMITAGCAMSLLALASLWTAVVLYTGLATSLAWGEGETIWVRADVPGLLGMAVAALVSAALLLWLGARRLRAARTNARQPSV